MVSLPEAENSMLHCIQCLLLSTPHPSISPTLYLLLSCCFYLSPFLSTMLASPVMVLDARGGWYLIGSPSPQQLLHTISLTLSHPHNLHTVSSHHHPRFHFHTHKFSALFILKREKQNKYVTSMIKNQN